MSGRGWSCRAALATVVACVAATGSSAGDAAPTFEYVRDKHAIDSTVRSILARADADSSVIFVFDAATFDPPSGASEFNQQHRFAEDLPKWIAAIRDACPAPPTKGARAVFVAATTSERPIVVGAPSWESTLGAELHSSRWDDKSFRGFDPAHQWAARFLTYGAGPHKTLALVAGDVLPENWLRSPPFRATVTGMPTAESWRRKLSDVGEYWDAEKVGAAVSAAGARLFVVAPEARFGDFLPYEEIPQAPWATRPQSTPSVPDGPFGGPTPDDDPSAGEPGTSGRFASSTPTWFPLAGGRRFFNADSPSAYGSWPLARAAARTGGAYYLYPFPAAPWADACPRDSSLVDAMAPELQPASEFARLRAGDEALAAMLEAQRIVIGSTPWADGSRGEAHGGASSWCGFEPGNRPASRWRAREKPYDELGGQRSVKAWKETGAKLAAVVADYDRAVRVLAEAQEKLAAKEVGGTCRRSEANLRLCRFWFEMSAFHLDALRLYLTEIERFMPPGGDAHEVVVAYVPAIRMSDCLDAYDGRAVSLEGEKKHGIVADPESDGRVARGRQSNILQMGEDDPDYRAKRDLDFVLFRLDARLVPRANRMIDAAREVMAHEARSAWGWVVYYSEAYTFIWERPPDFGGLLDRPGGPETPPMPGPPSGGGGGSTPK